MALVTQQLCWQETGATEKSWEHLGGFSLDTTLLPPQDFRHSLETAVCHQVSSVHIDSRCFGLRRARYTKALPPLTCMVTATPLMAIPSSSSSCQDVVGKGVLEESRELERHRPTKLTAYRAAPFPKLEPNVGIHLEVDGRIVRYFTSSDVIILNQLAHGANGQLFTCRLQTPEHEILSDIFAVKLTKNSASLQRECETLEILNHLVPDSVIPYVGRYHMLKVPAQSDSTVLSPLPRMALAGIIMQHMPYSDFFDLLSHLQEPFPGERPRQPLHPRVARWYTIDLLNRLYALHAVEYYHGDVKPENIMMRADGHLLLADLGETRRDIPENWGIPNLGTPITQAPELYEAWQGPRRPSDIWSVGVILFDMLFGYMPFDGHEPLEVHNNILSFFNGDAWPSINKWDPFAKEKEEALEFLKLLLVPTAKRRIWWPEILAHKWIKVEWSAVVKKLRQAPLIHSDGRWIPGRGWAPLL